MSPSVHSRIGASSMHRWAACPASVKLSEGIPKTSSKYADEGTKAHDLAEKMILSAITEKQISEYDDEMIGACRFYADEFNAAKVGAKYWAVEEKCDLSALHPGLFGTSDGVIYHEETKVLQTWDFKYGQGIAVEVEDNEQLKYYALGVLMKTQFPCEWIELVIVQPRCYHPDGPIRRWKISAVDLMDFSADLVEFAKKTEDPNAAIVSGDHCRFCPASAICPTLHSQALESAKNDFSPTRTYEPEMLAKMLEVIPAIEAWAKSVKEFAFREAQAGRIPPGFKLVPKRATRKWKDPEQVGSSLAIEFGLDEKDIYETPAIKSPAQIEGFLTGKAQKKLLEEYVIKASTGDTLAKVSDKRPESKSAIETEFTQILE